MKNELGHLDATTQAELVRRDGVTCPVLSNTALV